jgi:hypothetical protein
MSFNLGANTTNNARAKATNAVVQAIDAGTGNAAGQVLIYTGSQPASPETTATGTLLATIPFANPAFASADATGLSGLAGGTAISATIAATGTAGWFRVVDRDSHPIFDGAISTSGSDMNFDSTSFVSGGTVTISSMTYQTPM